MSELSERVINNLIERNANLEWELEKKQEIIDKAKNKLENMFALGNENTVLSDLLELNKILNGEKDKEKEK